MADEDFTAFVRGAQRRLVRYADLLCGDRGRAEDLVQQAFMKTYLAWKRVGQGNPEAYARTIISHACIDWWRRKPWRETVTDALRDDEVATSWFRADSDLATEVAHRDLVMRVLAELRPRERAMVVLRYQYGLTDAEVGDELGCPAGTVKSTVSRALAKLRTHEDLRREAVRQGA